MLELVTAHGGVAPALWWVEVLYAPLMAEFRGHLKLPRTAVVLRCTEALATQIDYPPDGAVLFRPARSHQLSVQDAVYLELSIRHHCPLATLAHQLGTAEQAEGVALAV